MCNYIFSYGKYMYVLALGSCTHTLPYSLISISAHSLPVGGWELIPPQSGSDRSHCTAPTTLRRTRACLTRTHTLHTSFFYYLFPFFFLLSHNFRTHLSFLPSKSSHFHSVPLSSLLQSIHLPLLFPFLCPDLNLKSQLK